MQKANSYSYSLFIIGTLFFIFGFVTWLNGTLIPFLRLACDLQTDAQALLVTFAFYMAYFFLALPSSAILGRTGYKEGMALGLVVMAAGALLFIPAAYARSFPLFLSGLFVQGMGLSLLQTASNPYISVIGPIESAASRISIMGICNKVAGALSPLVLSALVLSDAAAIEQQIQEAANTVLRTELLEALARRIVIPYAVMAAVLVLLALLIRLSALPEVETENSEVASDKEAGNKTSVLQFPHLLLGALCIFVYVGAEVMAGDVIGPYGKAQGISLDETKNFTSYTLWSMVVGYVVGIFAIPKFISQQQALKYSAVTGLVFSVLAYLTQGYTSILFIALLGLANALMWPAIFPLAIDGLGRFTKIGSALLIMGIAGGAVIPQIYGWMVSEHGLGLNAQVAFTLCVLPCYFYILYYSVSGYKAGKRF
ncbi:MAG: glucose/galactose MFS transporter [Cyclobacteriaceae bacterium]|nr:MAG: glucose/galactose MFS transporter [Cyclobacteriaceae bacterium]